MEKEYIEKIIPIVLKHDLLIIADEIYAELCYGEKFCSVASFPKLKDTFWNVKSVPEVGEKLDKYLVDLIKRS